ncbi:hypothetical protein ACQJBY_048985 [Aegilops geniculata]
MARLLRALRLFAALADGGLWTHACRVSVSASWVPVPLCASWACRCGGQGPPFLLDFPHFFFFCFSFCARSLRPLAARSLRRLAPSCSNALSSGSVPWPSVPPLVLLVELCWISRWLLRRSLGHSVLAVQNLRLAHRRVFILLVGPRQEILKKIHVGLACLTSYSNEPLQAPSHWCSVHKSARDVKAAVAYCQLPIKYKPIMLSFSSSSTKKLQLFYIGNYDISGLLLCTWLLV